MAGTSAVGCTGACLLGQCFLESEELLHKVIIGPRCIPLGLHDCDGLSQRASLVLHDVSEQEDRAAGDGGGAVHQGTSAGSPGCIDGGVDLDKVLGSIPGALS